MPRPAGVAPVRPVFSVIPLTVVLDTELLIAQVEWGK
jgi:hypothetical protein